MPAEAFAFMDQSAVALVGSTPLLAVDYRFMGRRGRIHVKAENFNLTGSVKDRMALHILRKACDQGILRPGAPIAEASSGNTGISFAALGRALGHPVTIFMPDWVSREREFLMRSLGARVVRVGRKEGGFKECIRLTLEFAGRNPGCFLPCQYSNADNVASHREGTGPEIRYQLANLGLRPSAFVAGVGTGGTIMGVGSYLKERNSCMRVHPLEPSNCPILSRNCPASPHRIEGFADQFVPALVKREDLDEPLAIRDGDAILMAQMLASRLGLGVGISSGANFLGAVRVQEKMGSDAVVVTLFPDDNRKYLSTDLLKKEPLSLDFISPFIELESYRASRVQFPP